MTHQDQIERLRENVSKVYHGNRRVIDLAIATLLARGHLLLEDVPGVGKTTLAAMLSGSINCAFNRVQFTSDLLPSDILGVTIYNQDVHQFEFKKGPLFTNVLLADEINRTTPKTQSALLEAMNSARVSIDGEVYHLPQPFMVVATQNPLEFHGTFPLPKSQRDRFLMRLHVGYPDPHDEVRILKEQRLAMVESKVDPVIDGEEVLAIQEAVSRVRVDDDLLAYIVRIGQASRSMPRFELGVSTRGLLALRRAAQAWAYMQEREFVTPDDVQEVSVPVLAHRLQLVRTFEQDGFTHQEEAEAVEELLRGVEVPL